ncbi:TolC family protein [Dyadobacter subterraneus]|uniref:TolC family protein n=1 Tax=Dyadobacter subterraneus TaxID=2773304 RepID=A0ABR9WCJ1_9BACT|nr:TolC family protein [Dyadobacter subterraneus]MBE9463135.1 TolC family protein [Dyadobacter subterraneus]
MRQISILILLFSLTITVSSKAQESLRDEISYEYLDKLIAVAKKNYPKVKMYEARIEGGQIGIKRARLSYFDIISFSYLLSPSSTFAANPNLLNGYQFGFFINIGSLLQKPSVIKQARTELAALTFEKEAYDLNLASEVQKRYFTYVQHLILLRIKTSSLLDSESAVKQVRYKFEKGELGLENYNNALNALSGQQQVKITAETDVLIAKSSLEELLGEKLDNIK